MNGDWSRLAAERARAGDEAGAYFAAIRASALDPNDSARIHLRPTSHTAVCRPDYHVNGTTVASRSVPWNGLRELGVVRAIDTPQAKRGAPLWDLGRGVVAYEGRNGGWIAYDILAEEVRWCTKALKPMISAGRDVLWRDSASAIHRVDPLTGAARPAQIDWRPDWHDDHYHGEFNIPFTMGDRLLGCVTVWANTNYGSEEPSRRELTLFDLETGEIALRVALPTSDELELVPSAERLFTLVDRERLRAFDLEGRTAWAKPAPRCHLLGAIDRRLFISTGRDAGVLDAADGKEVARIIPFRPPVLVTREALAFVRQDLAIHDRRNLDELWRADLPDYASIVATGDALVMALPAPDWKRRYETGLAQRVVSLDQYTGAELSSVHLGSTAATIRPTPVAGRLVFLAHSSGPTLIVVEDATLRQPAPG